MTIQIIDSKITRGLASPPHSLPDNKGQGYSLTKVPGFYDCCVGEEKRLFVRYRFHRLTFIMNIGEHDRILIPSRCIVASLSSSSQTTSRTCPARSFRSGRRRSRRRQRSGRRWRRCRTSRGRGTVWTIWFCRTRRSRGSGCGMWCTRWEWWSGCDWRIRRILGSGMRATAWWCRIGAGAWCRTSREWWRSGCLGRIRGCGACGESGFGMRRIDGVGCWRIEWMEWMGIEGRVSPSVCWSKRGNILQNETTCWKVWGTLCPGFYDRSERKFPFYKHK